MQFSSSCVAASCRRDSFPSNGTPARRPCDGTSFSGFVDTPTQLQPCDSIASPQFLPESASSFGGSSPLTAPIGRQIPPPRLVIDRPQCLCSDFAFNSESDLVEVVPAPDDGIVRGPAPSVPVRTVASFSSAPPHCVRLLPRLLQTGIVHGEVNYLVSGVNQTLALEQQPLLSLPRDARVCHVCLLHGPCYRHGVPLLQGHHFLSLLFVMQTMLMSCRPRGRVR